MKRFFSLTAALVLALAVAGCGNKHEEVHLGHTEGIYVSAGDLTYQVQISRQLNPSDVEDAAYLVGFPEAALETANDEVLFGVWLRVENETEETLRAASDFKITDTQEREYTPILIDPADNPFVYDAKEVGPQDRIPDPDSVDFQGPIQGSMILFKVTTTSIADRPLEFHITPPAGGEEAIVDLDV